MIKAINDWVIVKPLESEKKNVNGFVVDAKPEKKGEVLSVGKFAPDEIEVGQIIVYKEGIKLENEVAISFEDIIGIIK